MDLLPVQRGTGSPQRSEGALARVHSASCGQLRCGASLHRYAASPPRLRGRGSPARSHVAPEEFRHRRRRRPRRAAFSASSATCSSPRRSAPGRWPRPISSRSACPTSSAACSPRARFASAFVPLFTKTPRGRRRRGSAGASPRNRSPRSPRRCSSSPSSPKSAMVWLTFALAPGFAADPEKFDLDGAASSRIAFPYLAPHLARHAALRRAERRRPLRRRGLLAVAPQRRADRGAGLHLLRAARSARCAPACSSPRAITVGGVVQLVFLYVACHRAGICASGCVRPR